MTPDSNELDQLLRERVLDLRRLDLAGFRRWLGLQFARWERDPVFAQRVVIRNLRRAHPQLRVLEEENRRAVAADAAGPHFARLRDLDTQLANTAKAVEGLTTALAVAPAPRQEALRVKLDGYHTARREMEDERAELERSSAERQQVRRTTDELDRFRAAIGLDQEDAKLTAVQTQHGKRAGRHGDTFEDVANDLIRRHVLPEISDPAVRVLRSVRLGTARAEFDLLVVRPSDRSSEPVEVLIAVEAKRNLNDVAHGFLRRQEDLAWFVGDRGRYDSTAFRTRTFPTGHFDRAAEHHEDGQVFPFGPGSFRLFHRDPDTGWFLDGLCLVTRPGWAWGVSAAGVAQIGTRISTEENVDLESDTYLANLLNWARSLAGQVETPDVLRMYATNPRRVEQILFGRF